MIAFLRSNAVALVALVLATTGSATAASKITSAMIRDGAVTSADVRNGTLTARDFKPGVLPRAAASTAGARGADGAAGPAGAAGTAGPTGAAGSAGAATTFTTVRGARELTPTGTLTFHSATCAAGTRPVGGGVESSEPVHIYTSAPSIDGRSWDMTVAIDAAGFVNAVAVCGS